MGKSDPTKPVGLDEEDIRQFEALGVTVEVEADEVGEDVFFVWDTNWDSLLAFFSCSTQWRLSVGYVGPNKWVERHGLDLSAVRIVLDELYGHLKRHARRLMFEDIQTMEDAAMLTFADVEVDD